MEEVKKTDEAVQGEPAKFAKAKILTFERFNGRRDLLAALLEDGCEYTLAEVEAAMETFMKGKVI